MLATFFWHFPGRSERSSLSEKFIQKVHGDKRTGDCVSPDKLCCKFQLKILSRARPLTKDKGSFQPFSESIS